MKKIQKIQSKRRASLPALPVHPTSCRLRSCSAVHYYDAGSTVLSPWPMRFAGVSSGSMTLRAICQPPLTAVESSHPVGSRQPSRTTVLRLSRRTGLCKTTKLPLPPPTRPLIAGPLSLGHADWVYKRGVECGRAHRRVRSEGQNRPESWDLTTGQCTQTLEGHTNWVRSVALSADGRTVVSGAQDKNRPESGISPPGSAPKHSKGHTGIVYSVALSADGRTVVSGAHDKTVRVWDLTTGQCTQTLEGHTGIVYSVALSADGRTVVSGAHDENRPSLGSHHRAVHPNTRRTHWV